jgi:hypothetical protein
MSKWFYDTSTGTATRAARCSSLFGEAKVRLTLGHFSQGGHKDLRGSGRRSVTPYVHGMRYCIGRVMLKLGLNLPKRALKRPCLNSAPARSVYSSRPGSYIEIRGPTGGPEVVEALYNI